MREIKFRAWDKEEKEWCEVGGPNFIGIDPSGGVITENGEGHEVTLMQSTGLKDKNGREIYEGDIVKHRDNQLSEVRNDEIIFEDGGFVAKSHSSLARRTFIGNQMEVIGTRYENPELLK